MGDKISALFAKITDWLNEQDFFQQLRTKYEELDPQSRTNLQIGGGLAAAAVLGFAILIAFNHVREIKKELAEKNELLHTIQTANDEIRNSQAAPAPNPGENWGAVIETIAGTNGIDKAALTVSPEKAGQDSPVARESLFEVKIAHVSIKQVIRYAFALESGAKPVRLRSMSIDTKNDPTGYLDATFNLSTFTVKGDAK